jgi:hypothetical protein
MTNDDFNQQIFHENIFLFCTTIFCSFAKNFDSYKAICYIESLINQLRYQIPTENTWSQIKSGQKSTRKPNV